MFDTETSVNFIHANGKNALSSIAPQLMIVGSLEEVAETVDVAVVFGGDGTMLNTSKYLAASEVPLLGINLGRLGFITDVPSTFDPDLIIKMLDKKEYTIENRTMLNTLETTALNEIVISRAAGKILEFRVYIDEEYAYQARGDGLMVSTPTGSTAYAMSAGGAIINPTSRVFEVVPMMPQSLSCRPLIINDTSGVTFELIHGEAEVYADGIKIRDLTPPDIVEITIAQDQARFIHPRIIDKLTYSYYHTLREKLNWQHLPGNPRD
jgi:NAD+ kinase